jgi:UDP-glucose 4-epimerase
MRPTVLVTGGSGFIGSHVVDRLAAAGLRPKILDSRPSPWHEAGAVETVIGDVRRIEDVQRAMSDCTAVCHLAAAADVGEVQSHPAWATELNSTGTLHVLEAARQAGVKRVLYASTVWVYSDVDGDVADEETLLPQPAHLYTAGKLSGELYCRSYAELYGLEPTVVRFGIPYGPRARPAAVIPSFVEQALRGGPLKIAGSGEQQRSFVYVEDLAEGVVRALVSPKAPGRTYNLAGTETTTIRELAEIVRDEVAPTEIVHTEGRAGDLRGARISSVRAEEELGWRADTPLREGVRRYAEWFKAQPETVAAPSQTPGRAVEPAGEIAPAHRRLAALLASGVPNPAVAGLLSLIAVTSATATVVIGAQDEAPAADLSLLGITVLLPLWALTAVHWAPAHRRLQSIFTVVYGVLAVVVLGMISATTSAGGMPRASLGLAIGLSMALTAALRVIPPRLSALAS